MPNSSRTNDPESQQLAQLITLNGAPTLLIGPQAESILSDPVFIREWEELQSECTYATAFQGPAFVRAWYTTYGVVWQPVIVISRNVDGRLGGLWPLAWRRTDGTLAHAGAHQAEYHAWLARSDPSAAFVRDAWHLIQQSLPVRQLAFKYLPDPSLANILNAGLRHVEVRRHQRPLLRLRLEDIRASIAKKSNKSRMNRLKRLGAIEFVRIDSVGMLDRYFDTLIDYYDFRQEAVHQSSPFREDRLKREFHRRLLEQAPGQVVATVTLIAGKPVAAYWGLADGNQTHLGMLIHSPVLAEHSPGKLHLMQLSEYLIGQGVPLLDLTPGQDAWKERFANDHDQVDEAIIYASRAQFHFARARNAGLRMAKAALSRIGISTVSVKTWIGVVRRASPQALFRKVRNWISEKREYRIYRLSRSEAVGHRPDERIKRNDIHDLLLFAADDPWRSRDGFVKSALYRLEQGESCHTISISGQLAHYGWLVKQSESRMSEVDQVLPFPAGSVALYDFYTAVQFRGQGLYRATIGHMLAEAFMDPGTEFAYISVMADNIASRNVIEKLGFAYQGSYHWRQHFGRVEKWRTGFDDPERNEKS